MRSKKIWVAVFLENKPGENLEFNRYANLIGNLFTNYQPSVHLKATNKIVVELYKEAEALFIFPIEKGASIYTVRETFAFEKFKKGSDIERKKLLLKTVYNCLILVYKHLDIGLHLQGLKLAYEKILDHRFELSVPIAQGRKQNRDKTLSAVILVDYYLDHAVISADFTDKHDVLLRKVELFKTWPSPYFLSRLIKSAKWINDNVFCTFNNTKEFIINININGETYVEYAPIERDAEGVKEEILFFTLEMMIKI